MKIENAVGISATHPALAGHFPGNPIFPGVALLDEVLAAAQTIYGKEIILAGIPQVKFLLPLRPGTAFSIEFNGQGNHLKFTCSSEQKVLAIGQLDLL